MRRRCEEEIRILQNFMGEDPLDGLGSVMSLEELLALKKEAAGVSVHPLVAGYLADLAAATRKQERILTGVSPRGTLALMRAAKAWACMEGRDYVIPDDVKALAPCVLAHRLMLSYGRNRQEDGEEIIEEILGKVAVPVEDFGRDA